MTTGDVWSLGDYGMISRQTVLMSELLCEAVDLRASERVIDVACGDGNTAIAAARRGADVTAVDLAQNLLERGRARARAEGVTIDFQAGDAEHLQFADASFDVALSTIGVMFASDQVAAARELARVCRPGGRIGLANWAPGGFHGHLIRVLGDHAPPEQAKGGSGQQPAVLWGTPERIDELFGPFAAAIDSRRRDARFRYRSRDDWFSDHERQYGPLIAVRDALDDVRRTRMTVDLDGLIERFDQSSGPDVLLLSEYLEVVITRAADS